MFTTLNWPISNEALWVFMGKKKWNSNVINCYIAHERNYSMM